MSSIILPNELYVRIFEQLKINDFAGMLLVSQNFKLLISAIGYHRLIKGNRLFAHSLIKFTNQYIDLCGSFSGDKNEEHEKLKENLEETKKYYILEE
jgi:hypothetical protein